MIPKDKLRLQIRKNREKLLRLVFEEKTNWAKISELSLKNKGLEKELKELK